jgi:hypothetical protein
MTAADGDSDPTRGKSAADSIPVRKIDDATHGRPPTGPVHRRLLPGIRWFVLDANRVLVAGVLLFGFFLVSVLVGAYGPVPVQSFLGEGVSPADVLVELLRVITSVVVIVLSINQLVLSPGLGPVAEQESRFSESVELRERVEEHTGVSVSPTAPSSFLAVILRDVEATCEALGEETSDGHADAYLERVDDYASTVGAEAATVRSLLEGRHFGQFEVVSAALRFAVSGKVQGIRKLQRQRPESLSPAVDDGIDELADLLALFAVSREYLKTVYIREEYINLSESLLYTGLPTLLATFLAIHLYAPDVFPGAVLGIEFRLLFVSAAVSVALAPFVVLISYFLRLAAMSRSTLFVGPFDAHRARDPPGGGTSEHR